MDSDLILFSPWFLVSVRVTVVLPVPVIVALSTTTPAKLLFSRKISPPSLVIEFLLSLVRTLPSGDLRA